MTEGAALILRSGGSITGFNESMQSTAIPEASTWAMMGLGAALLAGLKFRRRNAARFAF